MKLKTLKRLAKAMKDIAPVIEKTGFIIVGLIDSSNPSWEYTDIRIIPRPIPGSAEKKILEGEGF
jgi:hypothetical protein